MSALMGPVEDNTDALDMLLNILKTMRDDGNIPAIDYFETLSRIQNSVAKLRTTEQVQQQSLAVHRSVSSLLQQPREGHNGDAWTRSSYSLSESLNEHGSGSVNNYRNMNDILGNPLIDSFLDESRAIWPDLMFSADGTLNELATEMEEQFLFHS